ncbi:CRISPR-associated protein TIGR02710 family [Methanobrevibacter ruminantium M1]|uniref:CRISPR-associated protein TIGR02710 family n=1 Tax=Methanobrevibacter ruminantium (strain ATCC 35063 / DSM 1093 / JCM 13430 / OCM 146 / M1) TaxID=634498 RepID=D3E3B7_METRM|nr:CRISPR-associated protein TIGR02710 family [Methanobrevibacter ruminantium]ADC47028.1 CRISPR-associated protein TIGR02710 family [Methanobrevibacter ruminantium M1]
MSKKEQILILSLGGSPEPLIYSIKEFKPDKVVFLCSPQTLKECDGILEETAFNEENVEIYEIPDAESLDDSFSTSKKVLSKFADDGFEVRVDFTGGTKPMVSGLVLAVIEGNYSNFKFSYVGQKDSQSRTKNGVGVVKDGSEITKMQINPYKKYAITEFKRGKNFFNTYQFEAALENFQSAKSRFIKGTEQRRISEIYERIVILYQKWDLFEDKVSKNTDLFKYLGFIINDIEKDEFILNEFENIDFFIQMKRNYEFLSFKIRGVSYDSEDPSIKGHLKFRISYYLSDLFNNAYRRIEEGKYDDAVARLYRINELIAQVQLTQKGLIDDDQLQTQKEFKVNISSTKSKAHARDNYDEILDFIDYNSSLKEKNKGYFGIANDKSYELLDLFGIKQSPKFDKLNSKLKERNGSILAHGLKPMNKKKAEELYDKTLDYAKDYFSFLDEDMDLAKFPKF